VESNAMQDKLKRFVYPYIINAPRTPRVHGSGEEPVERSTDNVEKEKSIRQNDRLKTRKSLFDGEVVPRT
jgi:hypothetical protein